MIKITCHECGKAFAAKSINRKFCSRKCKIQNGKHKQEEKAQLCFNCSYATGGCSWSRQFVPVQGWDAEPTIIRDSESDDISSFRIKSCPQFLRG